MMQGPIILQNAINLTWIYASNIRRDIMVSWLIIYVIRYCSSSLSSAGMSQLLNICDIYAKKHVVAYLICYVLLFVYC